MRGMPSITMCSRSNNSSAVPALLRDLLRLPDAEPLSRPAAACCTPVLAPAGPATGPALGPAICGRRPNRTRDLLDLLGRTSGSRSVISCSCWPAAGAEWMRRVRASEFGVLSKLPCRATAIISCCSMSSSSSTIPLHRGQVISCEQQQESDHQAAQGKRQE